MFGDKMPRAHYSNKALGLVFRVLALFPILALFPSPSMIYGRVVALWGEHILVVNMKNGRSTSIFEYFLSLMVVYLALFVCH